MAISNSGIFRSNAGDTAVFFAPEKKNLYGGSSGEVPQFYVENSHPAIITPEVFDLVQVEIRKRRASGQRQSGVHYLSSRIVCGQCGAFFGPKVLNSTTKYRRTVWQCLDRYKSGCNCKMPYLHEAAIQKAFVDAFNLLYGSREQLLEDYGYFIEILTETDSLNAEAAAQITERDIATELIRKCVEENARAPLNQDDYQRRYEALLARHGDAVKRIGEIVVEKQIRTAKRERVSQFMDTFRQCGLQTDFNEGLWCEMVDVVTVHSEKDVAVAFRDGSTIHVDARLKSTKGCGKMCVAFS